MIVTASSNSNPGTTGIIQNIVSDNSTKHFVFLLGQCLLFSYSVENKFAAVFSFVPFAEMFVMETPGLARIRFLLLINVQVLTLCNSLVTVLYFFKRCTLYPYMY